MVNYLIAKRKIKRGTIVGGARTLREAKRKAHKYGKSHGGKIRIYPLKRKRG